MDKPDIDKRLRELSLFTGAGGGLLGTYLLGWEHVGYVEWNEHCQKIIAQRITDGIIQDAPIFGDIKAFINEGYAAAYQGMVDVITAGFPCQPFSDAGKKEQGDDDRDMWPETIEVIRTVKPRIVFLENVPGIISTGYIFTVINDLRKAGYSVLPPLKIGSCDVGADHKRKRVWIIAYANDITDCETDTAGDTIRETQGPRFSINSLRGGEVAGKEREIPSPRVVGNIYGVAGGMDSLEAIGNGQDPRVVEAAWLTLTGLQL